MKQLTFTTWPLHGKRVFVRADLNTPYEKTLLHESLKFQRLLPTLTFLKNAGAQVTLATHKGRPTDHEKELSTYPLAAYFTQAGFTTLWSRVEDLESVLGQPHEILILENLRFYPEEKLLSREFAEKITQKCDFYIQEAFGSLNDRETSLVIAPELFKPEERSIGFLVAGELENLAPVKNNPRTPYLVMVGGGKGTEKIRLLYPFLDKATHIALLPGLTELPELPDFIQAAHKKKVTFLLAQDYTIYQGKKVSIGPKTLEAWKPIIQSMQTIVYNGISGYPEHPETVTCIHELFTLFQHCQAHIVIAGGDTSLQAQRWGIAGKNIFLSTGGGATLAYLAGENLPFI